MAKTNSPPVPPLNPPCVVWNRNDPDGSIAMVIGLALLAEPPASSVSAPFALMIALSGPPTGSGLAKRNRAALVCPEAPMPAPNPGTATAEPTPDPEPPEPDPEPEPPVAPPDPALRLLVPQPPRKMAVVRSATTTRM